MNMKIKDSIAWAAFGARWHHHVSVMLDENEAGILEIQQIMRLFFFRLKVPVQAEASKFRLSGA